MSSLRDPLLRVFGDLPKAGVPGVLRVPSVPVFSGQPEKPSNFNGNTGNTENTSKTAGREGGRVLPVFQGVRRDETAVPSEWIEGLTQLEASAKLAGMVPLERLRLVEDARRFLADWGTKAAQLGWTTEDVFGLHRLAPNARYDAMGLVPLLHGRKVVSIAANRATIRTPSGGTLTYYRHPPHNDAVAAWELLQ
jgi:hypothetical protein